MCLLLYSNHIFNKFGWSAAINNGKMAQDSEAHDSIRLSFLEKVTRYSRLRIDHLRASDYCSTAVAITLWNIL